MRVKKICSIMYNMKKHLVYNNILERYIYDQIHLLHDMVYTAHYLKGTEEDIIRLLSGDSLEDIKEMKQDDN